MKLDIVKSRSLPPHEDAENYEGDDADGDGARDDDARLPGVALRHVGRADERRARVAQCRPVDDLDVGELSVEDDGPVVDAARGAAHLELVRVHRRQVVHDVLLEKKTLFENFYLNHLRFPFDNHSLFININTLTFLSIDQTKTWLKSSSTKIIFLVFIKCHFAHFEPFNICTILSNKKMTWQRIF